MKTKQITITAMMCALAYAVLFLVKIPVAGFLTFDIKDVVIAIGGLLYGPFTSFLVAVIVSFIEMITISQTGYIGLIMNILGSCAFACTAAYVYKKKRTIFGAVYGLISGILMMTAVMLLWNYLITPLYLQTTHKAVAGMLVTILLPFNLAKAGINSALALIIYKPLVKALRAADLLKHEVTNNKKINIIGTVIIALFLLTTGAILLMVLNGIL